MIHYRSKWEKHLKENSHSVLWMIILTAVICAGAAVCFMNLSMSRSTVIMAADYDIEKVLYAVTVGDEISTEPPAKYRVSEDYCLYDKQTEGGEWNFLGELSTYELTEDELYSYMPVEELRKKIKIRQITDSYILRVQEDSFYLMFQTEDGETYLAYGWEDVKERGQADSDDSRLRRLYWLEMK